MNSINFFTGDKFPLYREALAKLQDQIQFLAGLTGIGGSQNYIVSGVEKNGQTVTPGLIVIAGELLPFEGGNIPPANPAIKIEESTADVNAFGVVYPEVYKTRIAKFSANGEYSYDELASSRLKTNIELQKLIESGGDTPGTVKMWAGIIAKIPAGYRLCNGDELLISEYPELYENIGISFGGNGQNSFRLPNLSGRFVAGYDISKIEYNTVGNTGGSERVALEIDKIPAHKHIVPWGENPSTSWNPPWGYADGYLQNQRGSNSNDTDNAWAWTSPAGGDANGATQPHENRPPYFVLAYIIKTR